MREKKPAVRDGEKRKREKDRFLQIQREEGKSLRKTDMGRER